MASSLVNLELAIIKSALSKAFNTLLFKEDPTGWLISFEWIKQNDFVWFKTLSSIFSILFQWSKKEALRSLVSRYSFVMFAFLSCINIGNPVTLCIANIVLSSYLWSSS